MSPMSTRTVATSLAAGIAVLSYSSGPTPSIFASAKLADRSRVVSARKTSKQRRKTIAKPSRPIEGPGYRGNRKQDVKTGAHRLLDASSSEKRLLENKNSNTGSIRGGAKEQSQSDVTIMNDQQEQQPWRRQLSSQLTGCCTNYISYSAMAVCSLYGEDCESGEQPSTTRVTRIAPRLVFLSLAFPSVSTQPLVIRTRINYVISIPWRTLSIGIMTML